MNLAAVEENPCSIAGVTNILRFLHKYIPQYNGNLHVIATHGDGLSVERMHDAIRHNSGGETPVERLEGVLPVPQEFHKRMILLQVHTFFDV